MQSTAITILPAPISDTTNGSWWKRPLRIGGMLAVATFATLGLGYVIKWAGSASSSEKKNETGIESYKHKPLPSSVFNATATSYSAARLPSPLQVGAHSYLQNVPPAFLVTSKNPGANVAFHRSVFLDSGQLITATGFPNQIQINGFTPLPEQLPFNSTITLTNTTWLAFVQAFPGNKFMLGWATKCSILACDFSAQQFHVNGTEISAISRDPSLFSGSRQLALSGSLADGSRMVVSQDPVGFLYALPFSADGIKGNEVVLQQTTLIFPSGVIGLTDPNTFAIYGEQHSDPLDPSDILAEKFNKSSSMPIGDAQHINQQRTGYQGDPVAARRANGDVHFVWRDSEGEFWGPGPLKMQVLKNDMTDPLYPQEVEIESDQVGFPAMDVDPETGESLVAYFNNGSIQAQRRDQLLNPVCKRFSVSPPESEINTGLQVLKAPGGFQINWVSQHNNSYRNVWSRYLPTDNSPPVVKPLQEFVAHVGYYFVDYFVRENFLGHDLKLNVSNLPEGIEFHPEYWWFSGTPTKIHTTPLEVDVQDFYACTTKSFFGFRVEPAELFEINVPEEIEYFVDVPITAFRDMSIVGPETSTDSVALSLWNSDCHFTRYDGADDVSPDKQSVLIYDHSPSSTTAILQRLEAVCSDISSYEETLTVAATDSFRQSIYKNIALSGKPKPPPTPFPTKEVVGGTLAGVFAIGVCCLFWKKCRRDEEGQQRAPGHELLPSSSIQSDAEDREVTYVRPD